MGWQTRIVLHLMLMTAGALVVVLLGRRVRKQRQLGCLAAARFLATNVVLIPTAEFGVLDLITPLIDLGIIALLITTRPKRSSVWKR